MTETTATVIRVILRAEATCTVCKKRLEIANELTEEQLSTGNTTQMASYWAKSMRAQVDAAKERALWDEKMCGACRCNQAETDKTAVILKR